MTLREGRAARPAPRRVGPRACAVPDKILSGSAGIGLFAVKVWGSRIALPGVFPGMACGLSPVTRQRDTDAGSPS